MLIKYKPMYSFMHKGRKNIPKGLGDFRMKSSEMTDSPRKMPISDEFGRKSSSLYTKLMNSKEMHQDTLYSDAVLL